MNVLVTGGAGYIGSHLARRLRQAAHEVRLLDLEPPTDDLLADPGCDFSPGCVTDAHLVAQACQAVDAVYHLAWSFRAWRDYPASRPEEERCEIQENLVGTLQLLGSSLKAGVRHFLFVSSAVVYGPTGAVRVDEEHPCHPERTALGGPVYGITKLACERLCLLYQRRGLPVTVFRLHGVFGAGNVGQFGQMIEQALARQPVTAVRGAGGEYAHLDDVLQALLLAADHPRARGEVFNLAGSHTYSDPDLAERIVEMAQSRSQVELVHDPAQEMISVSVAKLRRLLGFEPERGEFLGALIREALVKRDRSAF